MLAPGDLKRGVVIDVDGAPCLVVKVTVQTPSSRGAGTLWKVRARNLKSHQKVEVVYKGGDAIVEPDFERRPVQYLYQDGTHYHFMDQESFEQFAFSPEALGGQTAFLLENMENLSCMTVDGEVIAIELPQFVELTISECDPSAKGNSATGRTKRAAVETGHEIQVPEHLDLHDVVKIDTETGKFVSRVSKA
jgi:elongation factor P